MPTRSPPNANPRPRSAPTDSEKTNEIEVTPLCLETLHGEEMAELVAAHGRDEMTRRLFESVQASQKHGPAIRAIDRLCKSPAPTGDTAVQIAIVPGFLYRQYPHSGADGRMLSTAAAQLGWDTQTIQVGSTGRLAANASILLDWLARHATRPTVLASVSKGGSDIVAALQRPEAP